MLSACYQRTNNSTVYIGGYAGGFLCIPRALRQRVSLAKENKVRKKALITGYYRAGWLPI